MIKICLRIFKNVGQKFLKGIFVGIGYSVLVEPKLGKMSIDSGTPLWICHCVTAGHLTCWLSPQPSIHLTHEPPTQPSIWHTNHLQVSIWHMNHLHSHPSDTWTTYTAIHLTHEPPSQPSIRHMNHLQGYPSVTWTTFTAIQLTHKLSPQPSICHMNHWTTFTANYLTHESPPQLISWHDNNPSSSDVIVSLKREMSVKFGQSLCSIKNSYWNSSIMFSNVAFFRRDSLGTLHVRGETVPERPGHQGNPESAASGRASATAPRSAAVMSIRYWHSVGGTISRYKFKTDVTSGCI